MVSAIHSSGWKMWWTGSLVPVVMALFQYVCRRFIASVSICRVYGGGEGARSCILCGPSVRAGDPVLVFVSHAVVTSPCVSWGADNWVTGIASGEAGRRVGVDVSIVWVTVT